MFKQSCHFFNNDFENYLVLSSSNRIQLNFRMDLQLPEVKLSPNTNIENRQEDNVNNLCSRIGLDQNR